MASRRPAPCEMPNMPASSAALASPAADSGGSTALPDAFSAWRMTMTVVEFAVPQFHTAKTARLKATKAPIADSQIGVRNGRCCKRSRSRFMSP